MKCKVTKRTAKTITFIDLDENKTYLTLQKKEPKNG